MSTLPPSNRTLIWIGLPNGKTKGIDRTRFFRSSAFDANDEGTKLERILISKWGHQHVFYRIQTSKNQVQRAIASAYSMHRSLCDERSREEAISFVNTSGPDGVSVRLSFDVNCSYLNLFLAIQIRIESHQPASRQSEANADAQACVRTFRRVAPAVPSRWNH